MKFLLIGFLAFSMWSALSVYIYVCKIKGLCYESFVVQTSAVKPAAVSSGDTVGKTLVPAQALMPENMTIYFAFDKSAFNADSETDKYFNESNAYLDQNAQASLSITGFTDAVGTDAYNLALGYRRAQTLQRYFENKGIPKNKIIIESKGESEPADNNTTSAGRALNRRTVIILKK
jgi:outer membrane protein OmpA-like peptidoglycan-associated protein